MSKSAITNDTMGSDKIYAIHQALYERIEPPAYHLFQSQKSRSSSITVSDVDNWRCKINNLCNDSLEAFPEEGPIIDLVPVAW